MTREEIMQLNTDYLNGCESEHKMNELFSYVLSQESCTDAVSRQAVLKEFEKGTENLYGRIDKLPSVNSQPCDDAISRNAVLEKAVYTETEEGWCGYTVDVDYIKSLPSVTPSHNKHCKDCMGKVFSAVFLYPFCMSVEAVGVELEEVH